MVENCTFLKVLNFFSFLHEYKYFEKKEVI